MAIRKVQVWNDDSRDYTEEFRGETLTIPAHQYVVMEDPDASLFMGQIVPFKKDGQGKQLTVKALRKVYITEATEPPKTQCMVCKKEFKVQAELDEHAKEHAAQLIKDEHKDVKKSKFFS